MNKNIDNLLYFQFTFFVIGQFMLLVFSCTITVTVLRGHYCLGKLGTP